MKFLIVLVGTLLIISGCTESEIRSTPQRNVITVDGLAEDWKDYPLEYNKDLKLVYGAVHSDKNLYLVFSFNDVHLARMIAVRGLTLWVGENKKFGIFYKDFNMAVGSKRDQFNQPYLPTNSFAICVIRKSSSGCTPFRTTG